MSNLEIRPASPKELRTVLRLALGSRGQSAAELETQVSAFIRYSRELALDLSGQWLAVENGRTVTACTCIESPGRTAVLFLPAGESAPAHRDAKLSLIAHVVEHESRRDIRLLQCLIEPDDEPNRLILHEARFTDLGTLLYLEWTANERTPPVAPVRPRALAGCAVEWIVYESSRHQVFAELIAASYENSLDCRGLAGLRHIEDIIAGHKSAGRFDPHRWLLLRCDGAAAGCILLGENPLRSALELVYMGVHPRFRRRGIGRFLLQQGLSLAEGEGFSAVTLAVDTDNLPALALYQGLGFHSTHRRRALIRPLRSTREES